MMAWRSLISHQLAVDMQCLIINNTELFLLPSNFEGKGLLHGNNVYNEFHNLLYGMDQAVNDSFEVQNLSILKKEKLSSLSGKIIREPPNLVYV